MRDSLSSWTTFGIGGKVKRLTLARSRASLIAGAGRGGLVIGRGSNILASDSGYDGEVVINRYDGFKVKGCTVTAGSGCGISLLSRVAAESGLSGLEWAVGVPGSVGGAVRMNAGAFGSCVADNLLYADVFRDGKIVRLCNKALNFSYRSSGLLKTDVVLSAAFELKSADISVIGARMKSYAEYRLSTQPKGKSAGSVFKNPRGQGVFVGRIIEMSGLKGCREGGAKISDEHGNIIINTGGATARDVTRLIGRMKDALNAFGVIAEEEIVYIGEF